MPPSGVDYASEFLNGYAPEYVVLAVQELLSCNRPPNAVRTYTVRRTHAQRSMLDRTPNAVRQLKVFLAKVSV